MQEKNQPYDDKALLATVVTMTQGTVIQKLGMLGRDFCTDPTKYGGRTSLEEARTEIMYNILEEIAVKTGRPLIQYKEVEKHNEKTGERYTEKEKTILLDPKSIKEIEKSVDKAIVQMATEVNNRVDKLHNQAVQTATAKGQKPPQMNELSYSQYLLKAGKDTQASKFISDTQKGHLDPKTKSTFKGAVSAFKAAISKVFSKPISSLNSATSIAVKGSQVHGKHTEKLAKSSQPAKGGGMSLGS